MMSNKGDNQKRSTCPYDPSHIILQHRMQTHLVKCRRNFPDKKMINCMYNSTHQVPEPELSSHHETCSDRLNLDKFVYTTTSSADEKFPVPLLNLPPTELWDDDNHPTYDPQQHCLNNPILRNTTTLPQAERRKFRMEERQRMQQFQTKVEEEIPKELQQGDSLPRRPVFSSVARNVKSNVVADDVSHMMSQIQLGNKTVTVPLSKRGSTLEQREEVMPNGSGFSNHMEGLTGARPKKVGGRGRGSSLIQNK